MKKIAKMIPLVAIIPLIFGCGMKQDENQEAKPASTIEEIQAIKGKPARVVLSETEKLTDIRKYSGTIEGSQQASAIAKMSDPIEKINVKVGSSVKKDQVIAEFTFTGDNSGYQQAEAQVKLMEKSLARMKEVQAKGGISQQDIDQMETQLEVAKMQLEQARRATQVISPAAGTVTEVHYKAGEVPQLGSAIVTIANLNQVILKLNVTSQDIGFFKLGAKASVEVGGEKIEGKVTTIPLTANSVTRFFPVEVTFQNKGRKLLPGMFLTAELDARKVDGVVVPTEAIVYRNGLNVVWTVVDGKAKRKIVKLGVQTKETVQILEGLEAGETVMVEGMSRMNDGDKVLIVE